MTTIIEIIESALKAQKNDLYIKDIQIKELRQEIEDLTAEIERLKRGVE